MQSASAAEDNTAYAGEEIQKEQNEKKGPLLLLELLMSLELSKCAKEQPHKQNCQR